MQGPIECVHDTESPELFDIHTVEIGHFVDAMSREDNRWARAVVKSTSRIGFGVKYRGFPNTAVEKFTFGDKDRVEAPYSRVPRKGKLARCRVGESKPVDIQSQPTPLQSPEFEAVSRILLRVSESDAASLPSLVVLENPPDITSTPEFAISTTRLSDIGYVMRDIMVHPERLRPPRPSISKMAPHCGRRVLQVGILNGTAVQLDTMVDAMAAAQDNEPARLVDVLGSSVLDRSIWANPVCPTSEGLISSRRPMARLRTNYPACFDEQPLDERTTPWGAYFDPSKEWGLLDRLTPDERVAAPIVLTIEQLLVIQGVDPTQYRFEGNALGGRKLVPARRMVGQAIPSTVHECILILARDKLRLFGGHAGQLPV